MFSRIFQLTFFEDKRRQEENEIMDVLKTMENGSTPGPYSLHVEHTSFSGLTHRILLYIYIQREREQVKGLIVDFKKK